VADTEKVLRKNWRMAEEVENPCVFLEIMIGNRTPKRIEIILYADIVPKTAENFRRLCIGACICLNNN